MYPPDVLFKPAIHILPKGKYIGSCELSSYFHKLIAAYALPN